MIGQDVLLPEGGKNKTDVWATPQWLYDALDAEFGFTLARVKDEPMSWEVV